MLDIKDISIGIILAMETVVKVKAFNQYIGWSYERLRLRHTCACLVWNFRYSGFSVPWILTYVIWSIIKLLFYIAVHGGIHKGKERVGLCPGVGGWGSLTRVSEAKNGSLKTRYIFITIENMIQVHLSIHVNMYVYIW